MLFSNFSLKCCYDIILTDVFLQFMSSSTGTILRKWFHGNMKRSILKILILKRFLFIMEKGHKVSRKYLCGFRITAEKPRRRVRNTPMPYRVNV